MCTVNFQVYESYLLKIKTRKLSSPACSAGRGCGERYVTSFDLIRPSSMSVWLGSDLRKKGLHSVLSPEWIGVESVEVILVLCSLQCRCHQNRNFLIRVFLHCGLEYLIMLSIISGLAFYFFVCLFVWSFFFFCHGTIYPLTMTRIDPLPTFATKLKLWDFFLFS